MGKSKLDKLFKQMKNNLIKETRISLLLNNKELGSNEVSIALLSQVLGITNRYARMILKEYNIPHVTEIRKNRAYIIVKMLDWRQQFKKELVS
jgi:hypothetical protein